MKRKKKKNPGGAPRKMEWPHRGTYNIEMEQAFWITENAKARGISESEFMRIVIEIARTQLHDKFQAV